ncbi:NAD(P)-dependent oxidoreductase [Rhodobaculum claviforme]|uniref:Epimerase n=1 Tax=Rhodobaculum claviforme TaxID=1549854 RepID=A0A934THS1_9RHOB|nr:NAD(P)H-binding protein [Rhodobaculum claviforme]MBK5925821.1 epimerase [Rhodobaculum claviforme]
MAHLLIIGASGGIGLRAVEAALSAGHRVRALSRSAQAISVEAPPDSFEPFPADATDAAALATALEGVDAVILAVGAAPTLARTLRPVTLFTDVTRALLPAMQAAGVRRLVAVTGFGAGDSRAAMSLLERTGHDLLLGRAYADKTVQEAMIRDSDLDWLIVRPTILTNRPARGNAKVLRDPAQWRNGLISRADVAALLVREAATPTLSHEAPVLTV